MDKELPKIEQGQKLEDLDRPIHWHPYEPWGCQVPFRKVTIKTFLRFADAFGDLQGLDARSDDAIEFYAELLADSCQEPKDTAQGWIEKVSPETLIDLGLVALQVNGLAKVDIQQKKSGSTESSTAGPSDCAEPSNAPTPITSGSE